MCRPMIRGSAEVTQASLVEGRVHEPNVSSGVQSLGLRIEFRATALDDYDSTFSEIERQRDCNPGSSRADDRNVRHDLMSRFEISRVDDRQRLQSSSALRLPIARE